ncbi:hypothetical protein [Levilactobacillus cerevisiae]|nr:hypothetical protein [Levilactobacillus cerevisiae]
MKWRRYLIAGCVGLLVGLIGVSGQQTPHYVQAQADTQEISFQVTPFDEDNPNGLPPYGISAQGMTTSALRVPTSGPSITTLVEVSSDSLTNRKVLASYTANSSDTTSLGNDIPAYYRTISDTDNGIWTRADLAYIYKQHELTDTQSAANLNALDNFNGYWKDLLEASDTGNFDLNRSPYTLDQPKFESLLDEQFDLQTGTVNVPWKKSTANMTVLFKTSDGSTLPNKLEGADGAQVPEPKKDITGYPGEVVNDEAFIPTFTGYTADKSSVTFNADDSQTETVVYITDADLKTTTIHYQYADGTTAAPDAVKYGYKNATG